LWGISHKSIKFAITNVDNKLSRCTKEKLLTKFLGKTVTEMESKILLLEVDNKVLIKTEFL